MPADSLIRRLLLPELELTASWYRPLQHTTHLEAEKKSEMEVCPRCATPSTSTYDHRKVRLKDAPLRDKAVVLWVRKRRFSCKPAGAGLGCLLCRNIDLKPQDFEHTPTRLLSSSGPADIRRYREEEAAKFLGLQETWKRIEHPGERLLKEVKSLLAVPPRRDRAVGHNGPPVAVEKCSQRIGVTSLARSDQVAIHGARVLTGSNVHGV